MAGVSMMRTRDLFESRVRSNPSRGRVRFVEEIKHGLGLVDANGNEHRDAGGNRVIKEAKLKPESFSLQELAEAIVGPTWRQIFDPANGANFAKALVAAGMIRRGAPGNMTRAVLESTGFGLDPTAFLNINTYTAVVGGLIEVKILEAFQNPALIADMLAPVEATKLNGQKVIGTQRIGDRAKKRQPGQKHTRAQFGERWIQTPETRENALALDVLKETVFFDLTGDVLNTAASVGDELAYRKELEVISVYIGASNPFIYNGYTADTYSTSGTAPTGSGFSWYTNQQANDLIDWQSVQTAWLLFQRQVDPHTGKRILINPNMVLVNPARVQIAQLIFGATETERRTTNPTATQSTAVNLNVSKTPGNPFGGQYQVVWSPLVEMMCTTAAADGGLALSQANADKRWWLSERGKAFKYMQNFPLNVQQAAPNNYEMLDAGIVATYFANERGIPSVWSPWHVQVNTH